MNLLPVAGEHLNLEEKMRTQFMPAFSFVLNPATVWGARQLALFSGEVGSLIETEKRMRNLVAGTKYPLEDGQVVEDARGGKQTVMGSIVTESDTYDHTVCWTLQGNCPSRSSTRSVRLVEENKHD